LILKENKKGDFEMAKASKVSVSSPSVRMIVALDKITYDLSRNRKAGMDPASITELANNIKLHGVLQNIILNEKDDGTFEVMGGIRRTMAAKEAGLMFMCEMGLDPGIDHMSASMLIHDINRVASDIDILIKDKNRYSGYINSTYVGDESSNMDNRLGYINFEYKKNFFSKTRVYEVDFFLNLCLCFLFILNKYIYL
jgi:hypothetical protein